MTDWWHVVKSTGRFGRDHVQAVWTAERAAGLVTAGYGNAPDGPGRAKLLRYRPGDRVFAYLPGFGAVGVGEVIGSEPGFRHAASNDEHAHTLAVSWVVTVDRLADAVGPADIRALGGYAPRTPAMRMAPSVARAVESLLRDAMTGRSDG